MVESKDRVPNLKVLNFHPTAGSLYHGAGGNAFIQH